jgi:phosphoenolpyruvate carboxylase
VDGLDEERAFAALRREVDLLGRLLGEAIRRFEGEALFALEEEIRKGAKYLRQHPEDAEARALFWTRIRELSLKEAEALVRAFSHYFNLVNLAEEHHRVRVNRLRQAAARPGVPGSKRTGSARRKRSAGRVM